MKTPSELVEEAIEELKKISTEDIMALEPKEREEAIAVLKEIDKKVEGLLIAVSKSK